MIAVRIKGATSLYGAPDGWKPEDGECKGLYVRKEAHGKHSVLLSAWKPSISELELLNNGGSVVLGVLGEEHPPVLMVVTETD